MPLPYAPNDPDTEVVQLRIADANVTLTRWVSYAFASDYLQAASQFQFVVADGDLPDLERGALVLGARVRLTINGVPLCDGHIDTVEVSANRTAGTVWTITGRERLGLAVDAIADPTQAFKESQTLEQILRALYYPFGWIDPEEHFSISNRASRGVTHGLRGTPTTKGSKKKGAKPLKSFLLHQCKPHNHEGVHEFAKRMTERHGLTIRCSEDGERIVVDTPNYAQEPSFEIRRIADGHTNVLDGHVRYDFTSQPACIIADGFTGGGEFRETSRMKAFCVNPYFGVDENGVVLDAVAQVLLKHPTAKQVAIFAQPLGRRTVNVPPRIIFLHDEESKKPFELSNYLRRQMSLFMRKSMTASYTVEGHGQVVDGQFVPWMVDTVVDVIDEVASIDERMWIQSVHYSKSRSGGTTTTVDLLRLHALQFGEQEEVTKPATGSGRVRFLSDDEFIRGLRLAAGLSGALPPGSIARNDISNRINGTIDPRTGTARAPITDRVVDLDTIHNLVHPNLHR